MSGPFSKKRKLEDERDPNEVPLEDSEEMTVLESLARWTVENIYDSIDQFLGLDHTTWFSKLRLLSSATRLSRKNIIDTNLSPEGFNVRRDNKNRVTHIRTSDTLEAFAADSDIFLAAMTRKFSIDHGAVCVVRMSTDWWFALEAHEVFGNSLLLRQTSIENHPFAAADRATLIAVLDVLCTSVNGHHIQQAIQQMCGKPTDVGDRPWLTLLADLTPTNAFERSNVGHIRHSPSNGIVLAIRSVVTAGMDVDQKIDTIVNAPAADRVSLLSLIELNVPRTDKEDNALYLTKNNHDKMAHKKVHDLNDADFVPRFLTKLTHSSIRDFTAYHFSVLVHPQAEPNCFRKAGGSFAAVKAMEYYTGAQLKRLRNCLIQADPQSDNAPADAEGNGAVAEQLDWF